MAETIPVRDEWSRNANCDKTKYNEMYRRSIEEPERSFQNTQQGFEFDPCDSITTFNPGEGWTPVERTSER